MNTKDAEFPSICQTCFPKIIKWKGVANCAPAAISNSLFFLAKKNVGKFSSLKHETPDDQARLVDKLGDYMNTTPTGGTTPFGAMRGLKKFLDDNHIPFKSIAATGFRETPLFVRHETDLTTLQWMKEGTVGLNTVWVLIGWAKYNQKKDRYEIFAGHWLTVVDVFDDRLIIKDPSDRAKRISYSVSAFPLLKGTLTQKKDKKYYPRNAKDLLSLGGELIKKPGATHAIIEGAYRLEI